MSNTWVGGVALIFGSGIAAALVLGVLVAGDEDELPWPAVAAAVAVVSVGGALAGLVAGREASRMRLVGALLMPVPAVLLLFVFIVGLSHDQDRSGAYVITVILYLLWVVPLVATEFVLAAIQRRRSTASSIQPPGPPPLNRELTAATRHGRAATVIREYVDDPGGQAHRQADTEALLAHGYDLVSVDKRPGRRGLLRGLTLTKDLLLLFTPLASDSSDALDDHVVATFRQG